MRGLTARDVSIHFSRRGVRQPVLKDVNLTIEPGVILGLTGPSGCGKTTLGRIMSGLTIPDEGIVTCDGAPLDSARNRTGRQRGRIGMVFQSPRRSCDPRLTLGKTLTLTANPDADLAAILKAVAITPDLLHRFPAQVSDGQLQRVAMARTLATEPAYMILDEMTAMLDPATTATLIAVVRTFAKKGGGVLLISHDHELVQAVAHEVRQL